MRIDIVVHADLLCPWCYLAKRSLDRSMLKIKESHPDTKFTIVWRPFLLYPAAQNDNKRNFYETALASAPKKTGEPYPAFLSRLQTAGVDENVAFAITGTTGPSQDAHCLVAMAGQPHEAPSAQHDVVDALFKGHFEEGCDLTDREWLVETGVRSGGLDPHITRMGLTSDAAARLVVGELRAATEGKNRVLAVPRVCVQGRFLINGYQKQEVYDQMFLRVLDEGIKR